MTDLTLCFTDRLQLRAVTLADVPLLRLLDGDEQVTATLGGPRTWGETEAYAVAQVEHWSEYGFGWWSLLHRKTGAFVGRGGLRHLQLASVDEVEIGYALLPEYWGLGLATELAMAAIRAGAEELGLDRMVGVTLPTNRASQRVLEKAGLRYAGTTEHASILHLLYVWHPREQDSRPRRRRSDEQRPRPPESGTRPSSRRGSETSPG